MGRQVFVKLVTSTHQGILLSPDSKLPLPLPISHDGHDGLSSADPFIPFPTQYHCSYTLLTRSRVLARKSPVLSLDPFLKCALGMRGTGGGVPFPKTGTLIGRPGVRTPLFAGAGIPVGGRPTSAGPSDDLLLDRRRPGVPGPTLALRLAAAPGEAGNALVTGGG